MIIRGVKMPLVSDMERVNSGGRTMIPPRFHQVLVAMGDVKGGRKRSHVMADSKFGPDLRKRGVELLMAL
jgi:hypothetical protein